MNPNENPYGFILNPEKPKQTVGLLQPQDGKKKIVLIIGFLGGVGIIIMLGLMFITSFGKANNEDLVRLQGQQTELLRVLDVGLEDAADPALRNRLTTLQTATLSDYYQLSDLLSKRNVQPSEIQLAAYLDEESDATLEQAKTNGGYDEALLGIVSEISNTYYDELNGALAEATTDIEKGILTTAKTNLEAIAGN